MENDSFDTLDNLPTIRGDDGSENKMLAGRYRIIHKLGEGGMGLVYLAEDTELNNEKVAIKFIPPTLAGNTRAIRNLKKEAQTARQLSHHNIVRLHDLHTDGHQKFLVMEYIDGKTLEQAIDEKEDENFILEELLPIAEQIAAGLEYAHKRKVLHRDIKPSNIMIAKDGTVKLLDFGIAREMKDSFTRVTGKETSGTLPYMSPQQLMGEPPTASMDIYSFGAVLYECLCGHPPFYMGDIREQIKSKTPYDLANVDHQVNDAIQSALSKKPNQRPEKPSELVAMLRGKKKPVVYKDTLDYSKTINIKEEKVKAKKKKAKIFVVVAVTLLTVLSTSLFISQYYQIKKSEQSQPQKHGMFHDLVLMIDAEKAANDGDYKRAIELADELITKYPDNSDVPKALTKKAEWQKALESQNEKITEQDFSQELLTKSNEKTRDERGDSTETLKDIIKKATTWGAVDQTWFDKTAPDFRMKDIYGHEHTLRDYLGQSVVIVFWATWAPPCVTNLQHLISLQENVGNSKLAVWAISNENSDTIKSFVIKNKINYTVFSSDASTLPVPFRNVKSIPCSFFINPEGKIKLITTGSLSYEEMMSILSTNSFTTKRQNLSDKTDSLINSAQQDIANGNIIAARNKLVSALEQCSDAGQSKKVKNILSNLSDEWLFSSKVFPGDNLCSIYEVKSGDLLSQIAKQYKIPIQILMQINGIHRPEMLRVGQSLKVINGPFHAAVTKSTSTLDLYLQDTFVRSFSVGIGKPGLETPTGKWVVKQGGKLIRPTWTDPDTGKSYQADDPDYPLGARWIGLEGVEGNTIGKTGYAIYGTDNPQKIGTMSSRGCIVMHNGDVILLYNLLLPIYSEIRVIEKEELIIPNGNKFINENISNEYISKRLPNIMLLLNSGDVNIRSLLRTELSNTFKATEYNTSFIEEEASLDTNALRLGLREAYRKGSTAMIAYTVTTKDQGEKDVWGSKMVYCAASVTGKVYNVKDGSVLFSTDKTEVRGSQFFEKAKEIAVKEAAKQVGQILLNWIKENI